MQGIIEFFADHIIGAIVAGILIIIIGSFFGAISDYSDKYIQDGQTKENIDNLESISMNTLDIIFAVGTIGSLFAVIIIFRDFFAGLLDLIKF